MYLQQVATELRHIEIWFWAQIGFCCFLNIVLYEQSFGNDFPWKAGPITFDCEIELIRIHEETFSIWLVSRQLSRAKIETYPSQMITILKKNPEDSFTRYNSSLQLSHTTDLGHVGHVIYTRTTFSLWHHKIVCNSLGLPHERLGREQQTKLADSR